MFLKKNEDRLDCKVIGSSTHATIVAASKIKTYQLLSAVIPCPEWATELEEVNNYPVFLKPDEGYGSRNVKLAYSREEAEDFLKDKTEQYVHCEFLPDKEYTIDCFSDRKGQLLFAGARERTRVTNGISVSTRAATDHRHFFKTIAEKINKTLSPSGAWFFQMKENSKGQPTLLEVATRLGGSSSYFRAQGVNFAMLSVFDAFNYDVSVHTNRYELEFDRALNTKYKINTAYNTVYVDFDDCIFINNKVNTQLVEFLYQSINNNKKIILITRHAGLIHQKLDELRITAIFDEVIHLTNKEPKSSFIEEKLQPIFIDDSHAERLEVSVKLNIPVFSPDMVEALLN